MLSVDEAVARISAAFACLNTETVPIAKAAGRVIGLDAFAPFDHPSSAMSAMDGYAVRAADVAIVPTEMRVIGEAPAGRPFEGQVGQGEAIRIFTGGVIPEGTDTVVIQEDTRQVDRTVTILETPRHGQNVRERGLDFRTGTLLLPKGRVLSARDVALLAAADFVMLDVVRRPRVALIATGDELSRPGAQRKPGGIVASSTYALAAMVEKWGGVATDIGIIPDRAEAFGELPGEVTDADLIVTQGGASVGDHDLVQTALKPYGFALDFWKIAMRPGKPLIFGRLNTTPLLGLPGNPVSAMVCAILFLRPAIAAMLGATYLPTIAKVQLAAPLAANGARQDYIRARIVRRPEGLLAEPFAVQDSSMQRILAESDGLIIRAIGAPAGAIGDKVDVLMLDQA